jgi:quaternary ammonium compound-resistance protein SugE
MLVAGGLLEIVWAFSMKQSEGFTRLWPSTMTAVAMLASLGLLATAMRSLPLGTAYTVWTGIGAAGTFLIGITILGEAASTPRVVAALLILSGLVLMKLSEPG